MSNQEILFQFLKYLQKDDFYFKKVYDTIYPITYYMNTNVYKDIETIMFNIFHLTLTHDIFTIRIEGPLVYINSSSLCTILIDDLPETLEEFVLTNGRLTIIVDTIPQYVINILKELIEQYDKNRTSIH